MEATHESVMTTEVLAALRVGLRDTVLDATLGGAGHFAHLLAALGGDGVLIGIDADQDAVERARILVAEDRRPARPVVHLVCDNFRNLARILDRLGVGSIDKALFDLGWSGYQLAARRGFSFQNDEPLFMTYGAPDAVPTNAAEIVNGASEAELTDLFFTHGEERYARKIARAIVTRRRRARILTTGALVAAVLAGTPARYHHGKLHPATKTFQALRIAANDELRALTEGLGAALARLAPSGRIAAITFHSVEDRAVKRLFADARAAGTPLPFVRPARAEVVRNRRARSAKLRVFERAPSAVESSVTLSLAAHA